MLNRIKDLGSQVANRAGETVDGITASVKGGVENLADTLNEKAVRAATAQMCTILEIALEEVRQRPIGQRPATLTASVNIGITALEMQIELTPEPTAVASDEN